ncbi:MAG TPA: endonuclease/exonuclease/phosphatase family protein [Thermoleophilaceae bacterium]
MASVKVCLWNVQDYGSNPILANWISKWGADSDLRNRLIRDFVRSHDIDVVLLMEVKESAALALANLRQKLNAGLENKDRDWCSSFCGSALLSDQNNPPQTKAHLTFATDARHEGYGVLWRSNQTDRFRMLPALANIATLTGFQIGNPNPPTMNTSPLNMEMLGRPFGPGPDDPIRPGALGGYTPNNQYPYKDGQLMAEWPALKLPSTSRRAAETLALEKVRRPVYVVLDLNRPGKSQKERLCPVGAYHAPSDKGQAQWASWVSGLSRELYVTNEVTAAGTPDPAKLTHTTTVVFGGDYNHDAPLATGWPGYYDYYTAPFHKTWAGGAACWEVPPHGAKNDARRTTVRLLDWKRQPITGDDPNKYLALKIDLVFRRPMKLKAERIDFLDEFIADDYGTTYGGTLLALHAHLNTLAASMNGRGQRVDKDRGPQEWDAEERKWKSVITGGWGATFEDWGFFMRRLAAKRMDNGRRAAELYRMFLTDHLPLVVEIPV